MNEVVQSAVDRLLFPDIEDTAALAQAWLERFEAFLKGQGPSDRLFLDDCYWQDILAFTWDIRTTKRSDAVCEQLAAFQARTGARDFTVAVDPVPLVKKRAGTFVLEVFFDFTTEIGRGRGIVRLVPGQGAGNLPCRAWTLLTTLQEIRGAEERVGKHRPRGGYESRSFGRPNWLQSRQIRAEYKGRDPEVVIVGGGHSGMMAAARLGQLGVDALIIDRNERIGDNWRKRYDALSLHNECWVCDLPYMPFPATWPVYLPKDLIADWLEAYAWAMDLNYWIGSGLERASFDEAEKRWMVEVSRPDGSRRILHPAHLVMATGLSGAPKMPKIDGLEAFSGSVVHAAHYVSGADWKGKSAVIIGTGSSAHDIAQDLHGYGAKVTMVQRHPTIVASVEPSAQLGTAIFSELPAQEDCDMLSVSTPYELMIVGQRLLTARMRELDRDLIAGLEAAGFRTCTGEDETGHTLQQLRYGGGFYLNVGCSELIVRGDVNVVQNADILRYESDGITLKDGRRIPADLIVLATGYETMHEAAGGILDRQVIEKIGPIWGFDDNGDLRNMWKQTPQENLWFIAGGFAQCRVFSRYLAIQVKAIQAGLIAHRHAERSPRLQTA